jgi:hypothetical protein
VKWADLLLLHELGIGTIVYDIFSKHGGGKGAVNFLGVEILQLCIENEIVSFGSDVYRRLLSEKNKGEDVAVL